jgi:hypothetical protein
MLAGSESSKNPFLSRFWEKFYMELLHLVFYAAEAGGIQRL